MRSSVNLVVQVLAVLGCFLLRLSAPGWLFVIFFVFLPIASIGLVAQIGLAACALFRRRLPALASVSSLVTAGSCLGAGLLVPDESDAPNSLHRPFDVLFGTHLGTGADTAGMILAAVWLAGMLATTIILLSTAGPPAMELRNGPAGQLPGAGSPRLP